MHHKAPSLLCLCLFLGHTTAFNIDSDSNRIQFSVNPLSPDHDNATGFGYALGFFRKLDNAR